MIVDSLLVLPPYNDKTPALRFFYYSPTVEQQMRTSAHYDDVPTVFEPWDRTSTGTYCILLHWHNVTYHVYIHLTLTLDDIHHHALYM